MLQFLFTNTDEKLHYIGVFQASLIIVGDGRPLPATKNVIWAFQYYIDHATCRQIKMSSID